VTLLRGENMQRRLEMAPLSSSSTSWPQSLHYDEEGMNRTLARLEKSLADELTVYEADEEVDEEEDDEDGLEEERDESAVAGETAIDLIALKVPPYSDSGAPTKIERGGGSFDSDEIDIAGSVARTFIKEPSTENWELLVELFRKNGQRWNNENVVPPPREDQPHQLLRVESDLTLDESLEAMEEEEDPKALSIIYEADEESGDEDDGEGECSIGGLMPEMLYQEETGSSVDYESDENEGDEDQDLEPEDEQDEEARDEVVLAVEEESSAEAPFAGQVDWPAVARRRRVCGTHLSNSISSANSKLNTKAKSPTRLCQHESESIRSLVGKAYSKI